MAQTSSFLTAFASLKLSGLANAAVEKLASFDPETATAADIRLAEKNYEEVLSKKVEAERSFNAADKEAKEQKDAYDREVSALKILFDEQEKETDEAKKASLSAKASAFEAEISGKRDHVKGLIASADQKKKLLDTYVQICEESLTRLRKAKQTAENAAARLALAKERERTAKEQDAAAGFSGNTGFTGFGASALEKAADKAEIRAQVLEEKNSSTKTPASIADTDPDIQAAMAKASGKKPENELTNADRLSRLSLDD